MKRGKKLLRRHKDYFEANKIDYTNFLYERETIDKNGRTHLAIIDISTNKIINFEY